MGDVLLISRSGCRRIRTPCPREHAPLSKRARCHHRFSTHWRKTEVTISMPLRARTAFETGSVPHRFIFQGLFFFARASLTPAASFRVVEAGRLELQPFRTAPGSKRARHLADSASMAEDERLELHALSSAHRFPSGASASLGHLPLVGETRFELATSRSQSGRTARLCYSPMCDGPTGSLRLRHCVVGNTHPRTDTVLPDRTRRLGCRLLAPLFESHVPVDVGGPRVWYRSHLETHRHHRQERRSHRSLLERHPRLRGSAVGLVGVAVLA